MCISQQVLEAESDDSFRQAIQILDNTIDYIGCYSLCIFEKRTQFADALVKYHVLDGISTVFAQ